MNADQALHIADQHHQAGRLTEAVAAYQACLRLDPLSNQACCHLGNALRDLGRRQEAITAYQRGLSLAPNDHLALNGLAITLAELADYDQAVALLHRAAAVQPDCPATASNLASALRQAGRLDESIHSFDRLLARRPDHVSAHWGLSLSLLQSGQFQRGWPEYEWRWRVPDLRLRLKLYSPRWDGSDLTGKTIVVHGEQGLGDNIHFARYIPRVVARGGNVILVCQPELLPLWRSFTGVAQCLSDESPPPPHDVHAPLMSLPGIFATTLQTIPADVPYLSVPPDLIERFRARLPRDNRVKVGLVWSGLPIHPNDHIRSLPLTALSALSQAPNAWFCSLQKGDAAKQAASSPLKMADWTGDLHDFQDTAALIAALDLIISVDTAVAHLAGALAKPVWLLTPFAPDWRWMSNRTDSPWYPSMRLFRQPRPGDWQTPIAQMLEALQIFHP